MRVERDIARRSSRSKAKALARAEAWVALAEDVLRRTATARRGERAAALEAAARNTPYSPTVAHLAAVTLQALRSAGLAGEGPGALDWRAVSLSHAVPLARLARHAPERVPALYAQAREGQITIAALTELDHELRRHATLKQQRMAPRVRESAMLDALLALLPQAQPVPLDELPNWSDYRAAYEAAGVDAALRQGKREALAAVILLDRRAGEHGMAFRRRVLLHGLAGASLHRAHGVDVIVVHHGDTPTPADDLALTLHLPAAGVVVHRVQLEEPTKSGKGEG